jgi:heat shock protein HslJ
MARRGGVGTVAIVSTLAMVARLATAGPVAGGWMQASTGEFQGVVWVLSGYGSDGLTKAPLAGTRIDLMFENERLAGSSGCNSFTAAYTLEGTALQVGPVAATRRACEPTIMQQEGDVLRILESVESMTIVSERLTLSGPAGALAFVAAGAPSMVGTWEMTGYNNRKQAVVSKKIGTVVTATWSADGRVSGAAGCNDYSGAYELNGTVVKIGPLVSTQKACTDPEVESQERLFLQALQASTRVELRGDILRLRDAAGATQATFVRQDP